MELMSLVPHERSWTENFPVRFSNVVIDPYTSIFYSTLQDFSKRHQKRVTQCYLSKNGPRIIHNCEVPEDPDEIDCLVTGSGLFRDARRWIFRKSVLSRDHPITRMCIRSTAAINYEISRHIRSHPWTIYPFSEIRSFWETWMTIFTIVSLIIVPFVLAYDFETVGKSFYVVLVIDFVFVGDIVLTLLTGHYDDSTRIIILDRKIVAGKYLKGFFILDVLSSLPVQIIPIILTGHVSSKWYWNVLDLTKIFRLRTVVLYSRRLRHLYSISFNKYKIFEMTTIVIICIHWATCLELYVALVGRNFFSNTKDRRSWIDSKSMTKKDTRLKMYLACANRATTSLVSSSHYLDVKTTEDILLNLVLTVVGRIGIIYIMGQLLQLLTTFHSTSKKNVKFSQQLREFMRYKELPRVIQRRLRDYHDYRRKNSFDRNDYIIENVSPQLREELLLHNYSRLIDGVDFFRYLPPSIIVQIVGFVRKKIYLTNDAIVKSGTPGDALYFIASGTVAIFTINGKEVCHLEEDSYFGEISLVMENEERTASVLAVETSEIWTLKRMDFLHCLNPHPKLLNRLQKIAVERLEKNLLADDGQRSDRLNIISNL